MEIVYINMDSSVNRRDAITAQALHMGKKFTRIPAIRGSDLTMEEKNNKTSLFGKLCTDSMIGCFLSHKKAWEYASKRENGCVIIEDDCILDPEFEVKAQRVIDDINEKFDILYFGSFSLPFVPAIVKGNLDGNLYRTPRSPLGLHCYYVTKRGASKLLSEFKLVDYHVDLMLILKSSKFVILESKEKLGFQYSTCDNSSMTQTKFPVILNKIADAFPCYDDISWSYHLSSPILKVPYLEFNVSAWTLAIFYMYQRNKILTLIYIFYEFYLADYRDKRLIAILFLLL